jgi:hypothetical protein
VAAVSDLRAAKEAPPRQPGASLRGESLLPLLPPSLGKNGGGVGRNAFGLRTVGPVARYGAGGQGGPGQSPVARPRPPRLHGLRLHTVRNTSNFFRQRGHLSRWSYTAFRRLRGKPLKK